MFNFENSKKTKLYISKKDWDTGTVPCHPCLRGLQMRGLLWWFCLAGYKSRRRRLTRRTRRKLRTRRTAHLTLNLTHLTRWFWIRSSLDSAGFFEWRPLNHWAICAQTKHDWTHIPLLRTDRVPLVVSRMSRMCGGRMAQKLSCRRQRCWRYWRLSELVQSDSANWLTRLTVVTRWLRLWRIAPWQIAALSFFPPSIVAEGFATDLHSKLTKLVQSWLFFGHLRVNITHWDLLTSELDGRTKDFYITHQFFIHCLWHCSLHFCRWFNRFWHHSLNKPWHWVTCNRILNESA